MTAHLALEDVLHQVERLKFVVRDPGLLAAAVARPSATVFGQDAYPTVWVKAAALCQSLDNNQALADGNKRLALAATIAFYGLNGMRLTLTNDQAYNLVMEVAAGKVDDVPTIAQRLARGSAARATPDRRRACRRRSRQGDGHRAERSVAVPSRSRAPQSSSAGPVVWPGRTRGSGEDPGGRPRAHRRRPP